MIPGNSLAVPTTLIIRAYDNNGYGYDDKSHANEIDSMMMLPSHLWGDIFSPLGLRHCNANDADWSHTSSKS